MSLSGLQEKPISCWPSWAYYYLLGLLFCEVTHSIYEDQGKRLRESKQRQKEDKEREAEKKVKREKEGRKEEGECDK
jgi:hypothetical protein